MIQKQKNPSRIIRHLRATLVGGTCLGLVSCAMNEQKNYVDDVSRSFKAPMANLKSNKKVHPAVAQAIGLMRDQKFEDASKFINHALQNDPQSIPLHLLNALVYEKMAEFGDSSRIDLAAVGYQNALNLDPNNLFAMIQLGKIRYKSKQYDQAQELFANALLITPNDRDLLQELAASSYYAYDAKTAVAAIDQAVKLDPQNALGQRSAAMIHASLGDMDIAKQHEAEYQRLAQGDSDTTQVSSRLEDWNSLYNSGRIKLAAATTTTPTSPSTPTASSAPSTPSTAAKPTTTAAPSSPPPAAGGGTAAGGGGTLGDMANSNPPPASTNPADVSDSSDVSVAKDNPSAALNALQGTPGASGTEDGGTGDAGTGVPPTGNSSASTPPQQQVIIDCYLLSIAEEASTSKGLNLLESLQVTLNPASWTQTLMNVKGNLLSSPAASGATGSTFAQGPLTDPGVSAANSPATLAGAATGIGPTLTAANNGKMSVNTFSTGISWAGLTYNLNIANAVEKRSEIVGRPTLHTFVGKQAVFFSGEELVTGLIGTNGGSLVRYPLGTTLFVTVNDLDQDEVTLSISVEGAINSTTTVGFNIQAQTLTILKTRIDTTAKMRLGETLMLGGIYQHVNQDSNDGVPGLKDIPVAQYLFAKEQTLSQRNSIVVLLTPRSTEATKIAVNRAMSRGTQGDKLQELYVRHPDWYQSHPNLVKVLKYIAQDPLIYYEFRNSDVLPPHWGWEPELTSKLDQILQFAYY